MSECLRDSNGHRLCSSAALPDDLCEDCVAALSPIPPEVAAFVIANPEAMKQIATVARIGGQKHGGGYGPGPTQTLDDHMGHARGHLELIEDYTERDPETGELDLAHAATRLVMALGVIARGGR